MALPVPKISSRGGNLFETIISALVILVALGFMAFFINRTSTGHLGSYGLKVSLADASGLSEGSEVRLAGVKVGSVTGLTLEPTSWCVRAGRVRVGSMLTVRQSIFSPCSARHRRGD